jgi:hypothetical protein
VGELLVIGLPAKVLRRLEARFRGNPRVDGVLVEAGKRGDTRLVPFPGQAVTAVQTFADAHGLGATGRIIVLPYAQLPAELDGELEVLVEMGFSVLRVTAGECGWPVLVPKTGLDQAFQDGLFEAISTTVGGAVEKPSEVFGAAEARTAAFRVAPNAIDEVDDVAPHRHSFVKAAVAALEAMAAAKGDVGPAVEYFKPLGRVLATSGGIDASLEIWRGGTKVWASTTNVHLKKGDGTSRVAAVRIYYETVTIGDEFMVVVLYGGPHPDVDVTRVLHL